MSANQIIQTVLDFFNLIEEGRGSEDENILALDELLDRLALAHHHVLATFEESDWPPRDDARQVSDLVYERFPSLDFYNVPDPVTQRIGEAGLALGCAKDDLADIARDLWDVRWRLQHTGRNDALYEFRESYHQHWGRHLRHLQFYLQARREE